ncbi:MAG: hypothetical protein JWN84_262 [Nocardioides sp.]|nr:hypothetical protein [Nocardioides sp.]
MLVTLTVVTVAAVHTALSAVDHDARRLRTVERDPRIATAADIEALVRAHGVREERVWAVADRMESARLEPALVWSWTMQHDGPELADLCRSRLTDAEVRAHLVARTMPAVLELPARSRTT